MVFCHPIEKYARQNGIISPRIGVKIKKYLKPPPITGFCWAHLVRWSNHFWVGIKLSTSTSRKPLIYTYEDHNTQQKVARNEIVNSLTLENVVVFSITLPNKWCVFSNFLESDVYCLICLEWCGILCLNRRYTNQLCWNFGYQMPRQILYVWITVWIYDPNVFWSKQYWGAAFPWLQTWYLTPINPTFISPLGYLDVGISFIHIYSTVRSVTGGTLFALIQGT